MDRLRAMRWGEAHSGLQLTSVLIGAVLLPPVIAVIAAPLLLLLFPVVWLAIPFLIASLLSRTALAALRRWEGLEGPRLRYRALWLAG
jgi:hypothetical protein